MLALSTWCRHAAEDPAEFVARVVALGAPALALERHLDEAALEAITAELRRRGDALPVPVIEAPCPGPRGGRAPDLASADREERKAAIDATRRTLRAGAELGAKILVIRLGGLELGQDWAGITVAFARCELGANKVSALQLARMKASGRARDLARAGLDPIVDAAASAGLTVALANQPRWFEIPDPYEILALVEDYQGAPIAPWLDTGADFARALLGFGGARDLLGKRAAGAWLSDAAGLRAGLPWGQGEVDVDAVAAVLPAGAVRALHMGPIALDEEIAAALARAA